MDINTNKKRIEELKAQIAQLPKGKIVFRTIRGKKRMYLYYREDGESHTEYIRAANEKITVQGVEKRMALEEELQQVMMGFSASPPSKSVPDFSTSVITGEMLKRTCHSVASFKTRECFQTLMRFFSEETHGKVCVIYGLRRTGKTTMVLQAAGQLPDTETAYIKINTTNTMADLNRDLMALSTAGYRYVFVDEVTLLSDFIDSASLLSDVYAMRGMKIVLSGTDSLGFSLSLDDELYDRAIMIHTTFIPFREYASLLGKHDIDEYIRYGGTFRVGETDFDNPSYQQEDISFLDDESTRKYIDTAIARNIQHSLSCYQNGGHFRHLIDLYETGELTSAVNRVIEDMNHRFLISVLTKEFESHDLGSAAQIQRKRSAMAGKSSPLDEIDWNPIVQRLKDILDIKNKNELRVEITQDHIVEIKEYLSILDLIMNCPVEGIGTRVPMENILFSQPGMRYCQAQALVFSLMTEPTFKKYDIVQRTEICELILQEVRGRMLEEIVLLETIKAVPRQKKVFKLFFATGEFDMVIFDRKGLYCDIYEIKHSEQVYPSQYRHLMNEEKCALTEHEFGTIRSRTVLYRGETQTLDNIKYHKVEEYLEQIK